MRNSGHYSSQRLETVLRPELALHLTQEMRLRLEILQANIVTLEEMLKLEIEQNPALELVDGEAEEREERESEEFSLDDFYPESFQTAYDDDREGLETGLASADRSSLKEHMMRVIAKEFASSHEDYNIARYILDSLDEDGFLHDDINKIAEELEVDAGRVEQVRSRIQHLEPVGIASFNIKEALIVQLRHLGYADESPEVRIIEECFDLLLQRRITALSSKLRLSSERIMKAFEIISSLDPKPGRNFLEIECQSVQPDITFRYREGRLEVLVNEGPLPPLRISAKVREILENPSQFSREEVAFAKTKLENARLFIKGLLQRRDTLTRLAQEILAKNYDFFTARSRHLSPLFMKDVAESLELHPSTISRGVKDKYVETPVGIFPLRSFFTKTEEDPVMNRMKKMIEGEDAQSPLTDAEIAQKLNDLGISISRRTVSKYRVKLNIPDCFQRKALAQSQ